MLYLLLNTSMFRRLPNDCCLQLSGPPVVQMARRHRQAASTNTEQPYHGSRPAQKRQAEEPLQSAEKRSKQKVLDMPAVVATQGTGMASGSIPLSAAPSKLGAHARPEPSAPPATRPKGRPSSWQRRRARERSAEHCMQVDASGPSAEHSLPPTQPQGEDVASPAQSNSSISPLAVPYGYSQWPKYMPKPIGMVIPRQPIFYCATFAPRPGLPAKRECGCKALSDILF